MQFDWVNVQQCLQTLQFQRCECVARHRVGGIACDILRLPVQWESCAAADGADGGAGGGAVGGAANGAVGGAANGAVGGVPEA